MQEECHVAQMSTVTVSLVNETSLACTFASAIFLFHTTHPRADTTQRIQRRTTG
jgi:hypothetical protein